MHSAIVVLFSSTEGIDTGFLKDDGTNFTERENLVKQKRMDLTLTSTCHLKTE